MEFSPLRFLDFDASQMLADQVRISQEEEARTFHDNLFENSHENLYKPFWNLKSSNGNFDFEKDLKGSLNS